MADEAKAADAPVAEQTESVVDEGNLAFAEIQGRFAQALQEQEAGNAENVSEEGEGESAEQATHEEPETEPDREDSELESESEEQSDDDDDVLSELKPSAANRARKRIDKLTARAKEAEEKYAALEAKLQKLESGEQAKANETLPFVDRVEKANTFDELQQMREIAQQTYDWADDHIDEMSVEVNGVEYDRDQIKAMRKEARNVMEKVIPTRARTLQTQFQTQQAVLNKYPAWKDTEHPDHQPLMKYWQTMGELGLQDNPYAMVFASRLVDADKWEAAQQKSGKKTASAPGTEQEQERPRRQRETPPNLPTADDTAPPSSSNAGDEVSQIEKQFSGKTSLSQEDVVAYFAAKERSKSNRKGK